MLKTFISAMCQKLKVRLDHVFSLTGGPGSPRSPLTPFTPCLPGLPWKEQLKEKTHQQMMTKLRFELIWINLHRLTGGPGLPFSPTLPGSP